MLIYSSDHMISPVISVLIVNLMSNLHFQTYKNVSFVVNSSQTSSFFVVVV